MRKILIFELENLVSSGFMLQRLLQPWQVVPLLLVGQKLILLQM